MKCTVYSDKCLTPAWVIPSKLVIIHAAASVAGKYYTKFGEFCSNKGRALTTKKNYPLFLKIEEHVNSSEVVVDQGPRFLQ